MIWHVMDGDTGEILFTSLSQQLCLDVAFAIKKVTEGLNLWVI